MIPTIKIRSLMIFQVQYRCYSNFSKWIEAIQPFLESLFEHLASSFITTDTYYEPSAPTIPLAKPWTKATDSGGVKRAIEKAKATEYARELSKIESDKLRMKLKNICPPNLKRK
jgi:hypothetical protein